MTDTAKLLIESRQAHKHGRAAVGKSVNDARVSFRVALEKRLAARASDPERLDPEWRNDLRNIHKGVLWGGRITPARLAEMDYDLEAYYREHLGESRNVVSQVDLNTPGAVVLPDEWRTTVEGAPPCGTCGHPKVQHMDGVTVGACEAQRFAPDQPGGMEPCECAAYHGVCSHAWESVADGLRRCVGCGERQALVIIMKREDSEAFKQLQREAQKKS